MGRTEKLPQQGLTRTSTISPQNLQNLSTHSEYDIRKWEKDIKSLSRGG
jgi:hypothetical protein